MKMRSLLLTGLIGLWPAAVPEATAQAPSGDFAARLDEFRYSLYPDLERMPDSLLLSTDFSGYTVLNGKAARFIGDHKEDIAAYQHGILSRYERPDRPSLVGYAQMDIGEDSVQTAQSMRQLDSMLSVPMARIYFIDPVDLAHTVISAMNAAEQSPEEFAVGMSRDRIAAPRIVTRREGERWVITVDRYTQIWNFLYDPAAGALELTGRYRLFR